MFIFGLRLGTFLGQSMTQEKSLLRYRQIRWQRRTIAEDLLVKLPSFFRASYDSCIFPFDVPPVRRDVFEHSIQLFVGDKKSLLDQVAALPALEEIHDGEDRDSGSGNARSPLGFYNRWLGRSANACDFATERRGLKVLEAPILPRAEE
jgi:hypothetical protein